MSIFRRFRKMLKKGCFLQSSTSKMVSFFAMSRTDLYLAGFLIKILIIKILRYIFCKRRILFSTLKIKRSNFKVCFPDFCFSNRKACDLYSPENLSGDGLKHTSIREKRRFFAVGENGDLSSNLPPKRKNRPKVWSAENQINGRDSEI